jgi:hypothetical protein
MKILAPTDQSGAVGNLVYTRNRQGTGVRARVTPLNPQTVAQQTQRSILGAVASEWRGLTQLVRNAWAAFAANLPGNPSAFNAYVRINDTRVTCGDAKLEVPPQMPAFGIITVTSFTATIAQGVLTLALNGLANTVPPDKYMVYGTAPRSQGVSNVSSTYRFLGAFTPATLAAGLTAAYLAKFGQPVASQAVNLKLAPVMSGVKGIPLAWAAIASGD